MTGVQTCALPILSEEEALRLVTINPAKMLHLDARMGSIKVGKDAAPLTVLTRTGRRDQRLSRSSTQW